MAWDKKIAARMDELMALTQVGGRGGFCWPKVRWLPLINPNCSSPLTHPYPPLQENTNCLNSVSDLTSSQRQLEATLTATRSTMFSDPVVQRKQEVEERDQRVQVWGVEDGCHNGMLGVWACVNSHQGGQCPPSHSPAGGQCPGC